MKHFLLIFIIFNCGAVLADEKASTVARTRCLTALGEIQFSKQKPATTEFAVDFNGAINIPFPTSFGDTANILKIDFDGVEGPSGLYNGIPFAWDGKNIFMVSEKVQPSRISPGGSLVFWSLSRYEEDQDGRMTVGITSNGIKLVQEGFIKESLKQLIEKTQRPNFQPSDAKVYIEAFSACNELDGISMPNQNGSKGNISVGARVRAAIEKLKVKLPVQSNPLPENPNAPVVR
jgi:hypothetical protein